MTQPTVELDNTAGECVAVLHGDWTLRSFGSLLPQLHRQLEALEAPDRWDLCQVDHLDSTDALILSRVWDPILPERVDIRPEHQGLFCDWLQNETADRQSAAQPHSRAENSQLSVWQNPRRCWFNTCSTPSRCLVN